MAVSILTLRLHMAGCASLKEKRGHIKPIMARLHREFNVAAAEMDLQDVWQDAVLVCVTISNDAALNQKVLQQALDFTERTWPEVEIMHHSIEGI